MKNAFALTLAGAACALLLVIPVAGASKTPAKTTAAKTMPAKKAAVKSASVRSMWPPETLTGKIAMVDANQNLVVVKGPDGVPFDMVVSRRTRIKSGTQAVNLKNLSQYRNKSASIQFVPERRGDVARSIRVTG